MLKFRLPHRCHRGSIVVDTQLVKDIISLQEYFPEFRTEGILWEIIFIGGKSEKRLVMTA